MMQLHSLLTQQHFPPQNKYHVRENFEFESNKFECDSNKFKK